MPRWLRKRWRALQLRLLARQTPDKLLRLSRERLARTYARALATSPAYAQLVSESGLDSGTRLDAGQIMQRVPVLEKHDLFERFGVRELLRADLKTADLANVLTSSGHGGGKFAFGLSTAGQMQRAPDDIDLGLQLAFDIDNRDTLLVNCLPMGVVFNSRSVCVANVSVREDMALAILDQAGPLFEQVILCVDPLFCKRLLDYADEQGFDWSRLQVNMVIGEETFPEEFRSYVAACLQVDLAAAQTGLLGSSMGVGELGLNLFFETRETIALRRHLHAEGGDRFLPAFFCFNPLRTFVEVLDADTDGVGDLVISMLDTDATIPMLRYRTGDRARLLGDSDLAALPLALRERLQGLPFPLIAVHGRASGLLDGGWHVDHFKSLLYCEPQLARQFSGAFRVAVGAGGELGLEVQLASGAMLQPAAAQASLADLAAATAQRCNRSPVQVSCHAYSDFGHGMGLDYERKFRYFTPA